MTGDQALAPMALNSLSNPPAEIATARVVDDKGMTVGAVQKVDIDGGKPSKVEIALLGSDRIIALEAGQLSYDKSNNVLTAAPGQEPDRATAGGTPEFKIRRYFFNASANQALAPAATPLRTVPQAISISDTFSDHTFSVARLVRS